MGIINKRNAVFGWAAWQIGKSVMKVKARTAVPGRVDDSMRPNKGAIAAGLLAVGGALLFWRRSRDDDQPA